MIFTDSLVIECNSSLQRESHLTPLFTPGVWLTQPLHVTVDPSPHLAPPKSQQWVPAICSSKHQECPFILLHKREISLTSPAPPPNPWSPKKALPSSRVHIPSIADTSICSARSVYDAVSKSASLCFVLLQRDFQEFNSGTFVLQPQLLLEAIR